MKTYFIPVMMLVHGNDEADAARRAVALLDEHADGLVLEKFVLPNHQTALGREDEDKEMLVFVRRCDVEFMAGAHCILPEGHSGGHNSGE